MNDEWEPHIVYVKKDTNCDGIPNEIISYRGEIYYKKDDINTNSKIVTSDDCGYFKTPKNVSEARAMFMASLKYLEDYSPDILDMADENTKTVSPFDLRQAVDYLRRFPRTRGEPYDTAMETLVTAATEKMTCKVTADWLVSMDLMTEHNAKILKFLKPKYIKVTCNEGTSNEKT